MGLGIWAVRDRLKQGITVEVAAVTSKTLEDEAVVSRVSYPYPPCIIYHRNTSPCVKFFPPVTPASLFKRQGRHYYCNTTHILLSMATHAPAPRVTPRRRSCPKVWSRLCSPTRRRRSRPLRLLLILSRATTCAPPCRPSLPAYALLS
jgi:hypothetical protein